MACQSTSDIAQLRARVRRLETAVTDPTASATYEGRGSISYRSYDDLQKMLDRARAELASAIQASGPVKKIVFWPGRGM